MREVEQQFQCRDLMKRRLNSQLLELKRLSFFLLNSLSDYYYFWPNFVASIRLPNSNVLDSYGPCPKTRPDWKFMERQKFAWIWWLCRAVDSGELSMSRILMHIDVISSLGLEQHLDSSQIKIVCTSSVWIKFPNYSKHLLTDDSIEVIFRLV